MMIEAVGSGDAVPLDAADAALAARVARALLQGALALPASAHANLATVGPCNEALCNPSNRKITPKFSLAAGVLMKCASKPKPSR